MVLAGIEHGSCVLDEECPYYDEDLARIFWADYETAMRASESFRQDEGDSF